MPKGYGYTEAGWKKYYKDLKKKRKKKKTEEFTYGDQEGSNT